MATRHPHDSAVRLAGELYGKILNRNADKGGFDYVLDSLQQGKRSVRQHAIDMVSSAEFDTKFVQGRSERDVVMLINRVLPGRIVDEARLEGELDAYDRLGIRQYAERLTQSSEYRRAYGDDRVPGIGHGRAVSRPVNGAWAPVERTKSLWSRDRGIRA